MVTVVVGDVAVTRVIDIEVMAEIATVRVIGDVEAVEAIGHIGNIVVVAATLRSDVL